MRYVVLATNNDGGRNATIHSCFDDAKNAARAYLCSPDVDPQITPAECRILERELFGLTGEYVEEVSGSEAWKERVIIAPIDDA